MIIKYAVQLIILEIYYILKIDTILIKEYPGGI